MLQAIRNNPDSALFYVEYFRFETDFLTKLKQRQEVLLGKPSEKLDFVEADLEEAKEVDSGAMDTSCTILEIVLETIESKFPDNLLVYSQIWKTITKPNTHVDKEFKQKVKDLYKREKIHLFDQFVDTKLKGLKGEKLNQTLIKLSKKYSEHMTESVKAQILERTEAKDPAVIYTLVNHVCTTLTAKLDLIRANFTLLKRQDADGLL